MKERTFLLLEPANWRQRAQTCISRHWSSSISSRSCPPGSSGSTRCYSAATGRSACVVFFLFFLEEWYTKIRDASCPCPSCLQGGDAAACSVPSEETACESVKLFKGSPLEFVLSQGIQRQGFLICNVGWVTLQELNPFLTHCKANQLGQVNLGVYEQQQLEDEKHVLILCPCLLTNISSRNVLFEKEKNLPILMS